MQPSEFPHSPNGHPKIGGGVVGGLSMMALALPFDYTTADGAALFTVPAGYRVDVRRCFYEVLTGFTGGSSSAIGASSSNASYATKGDLIGGAGGDVAATLVAGIKGGTIGAKFGSNGVIVLGPGDQILFNRVASAFTAGAGVLHVELIPISLSEP
jgi:hypothetical protein